jgi:hypothetical protein
MEMREGVTGHYKLRDHVQPINKQKWPTPQASDGELGDIHREVFFRGRSPRIRSNQGVEGQAKLGETVAYFEKQNLWPTPSANPDGRKPKDDWEWCGTYWKDKNGKKIQTSLTHDKRLSWPTPRKEMAHGYCKSRIENPELAKKECRLEDQVGGQLNPDWVEWLMNWPIGWTSLKPLKELIWLDWDIDPADMEKPESYPSPVSIIDGKTGNQIQEWGNNRFRKEPLDKGFGPIPRIATGIKDRVNRLKAIGNGQVPMCVKVAWKELSQEVLEF